jgi:hypothetical protein
MDGRAAWIVAVVMFGCGPRIEAESDGGSAGPGSGEDGEATSSDPSAESGDASSSGSPSESGDTGLPEPWSRVTQQWQQTYRTGAPYDAFCDVAVLPDGTIAVSGTSTEDLDTEDSGGEGWILRLGADGSLVSELELPPDHAPISLSVDASGGVFVVGTRGLYPENAEHFFALWDLDEGPQWVVAEDTSWGYLGCNQEPHGRADSEALGDGMLIARYENGGSNARIFDPAGSIVTEVPLGGSVDGFRTVAATGTDTFVALGERASVTGVDDDWAVLRVDSSGAVLWEQRGGGLPGELFAYGGGVWHFAWYAPEGPAIVSAHAIQDGAFATMASPMSHGQALTRWDGYVVALDDANVLTGYSITLDPEWSAELELPAEVAERYLVPGTDGALYVISNAWISRLVLN